MLFPLQRSAVAAIAATVLTAALAATAVAQNAVGVIVDRGRSAASPLGGREPFIHVFDPDTMQITGSVMLPIPPFSGVFDVEIAPDLGECYVGNNDVDQLWIIDLTTTPPSLAAGPNPMQLQGGAQELTLSPSGRYLVLGGGLELAVVDIQARQQTDSIPFNATVGTSPLAIEFAPDGSFVVYEQTFSSPSQHDGRLRRYRIDSAGKAVDTGDVLAAGNIPGSQNLIVPSYPFLPPFVNALVSRHTVAVSRPAAGTMTSLRTRGLVPKQTVALDFPTGIDLDFDPYRSIVYVRTIEAPQSGPAGEGNSQIDGYFFLPFTGHFGPRVVSIPLDRRAGTAYGVEQTAVDPVSRRLFVSGLASPEVRVFDSLTGQQVGTITDPDFLFGLGVRVRRR